MSLEKSPFKIRYFLYNGLANINLLGVFRSFSSWVKFV